MDAKVLAAYLMKNGFRVKSISTVDSLGHTISKDCDIPELGVDEPLKFIRTPFSRGLTGVALSKCGHCSKTFANDTALNNHLKHEHDGVPNIAVAKTENRRVAEGNHDHESLDGDDNNGTQYEIVDSSFIGIDDLKNDAENNEEETSYIILKTDPDYDPSFNGSRRSRRIETKPRKPYEARVKMRILNQQVRELKGPFRCVQCEDLYDNCCDYSHHYYNEHSKRRKPIHRCQICEKRFDQNVVEKVELVDFQFDGTEIEEASVTICEVPEYAREFPKQKQYQCSVCLKYFAQSTGLNQHMKTHSGLKPFPCDVCPKAFTQKAGLDQHKRIHNNLKPFACVMCHRRFTQSAHLSQHIRTHTKIEPFECGVCRRRFKQSSHLNFHLKSHEKTQGGVVIVCQGQAGDHAAAQMAEQSYHLETTLVQDEQEIMSS